MICFCIFSFDNVFIHSTQYLRRDQNTFQPFYSLKVQSTKHLASLFMKFLYAMNTYPHCICVIYLFLLSNLKDGFVSEENEKSTKLYTEIIRQKNACFLSQNQKDSDDSDIMAEARNIKIFSTREAQGIQLPVSSE